MREVADLRARAFDDFPVCVEQLVHFDRQRRDILRKVAGDSLGLAAADRRHPLLQHSKRPQAEADGERGRADQRQRQRQEGRRERPLEALLLRLDHIRIGGDLDEIAPLIAGVDLAFDDPEFMAARPDPVAAEDRAVIFADRHEMGKLGRKQRLRRPDLRRVHVDAGDLPVPAGIGELELRGDRRGRPAFSLLAGNRHIGDQRLEIDFELIVEIGFRPARVERAQAQAGENQDERAPEGRRQEEAGSNGSGAERLPNRLYVKAPRAPRRGPRWSRRPHRRAAPSRLCVCAVRPASRPLRPWPPSPRDVSPLSPHRRAH